MFSKQLVWQPRKRRKPRFGQAFLVWLGSSTFFSEAGSWQGSEKLFKPHVSYQTSRSKPSPKPIGLKIKSSNSTPNVEACFCVLFLAHQSDVLFWKRGSKPNFTKEILTKFINPAVHDELLKNSNHQNNSWSSRSRIENVAIMWRFLECLVYIWRVDWRFYVKVIKNNYWYLKITCLVPNSVLKTEVDKTAAEFMAGIFPWQLWDHVLILGWN